MPSAPKAPTSDGAAMPPRRTENGEQRTERPCGATGEAFTGGVSRRPASPESPASPVRPWGHTARRRRACGCRGCFPLPGRGAAPHIPYFKARNGGRRSRSAAKPQSDRWSPKRFAPIAASLRFPHSGNPSLCSSVLLCDSLCLQNPPGHAFSRANAKAL